MDNFGKFQPHQTADDKVVKASGSNFVIVSSQVILGSL